MEPDGLSGIFAGGKHANLKKLVLSDKFSFYGDGSLTEACSAVLPTPSSGYWYGTDGNQYTCADIKALSNPAGTYYSDINDAIWHRDSKKYMHLSAMKTYHDLLNTEIDTKLDVLKEGIDKVEDITSEEILALFN